MIDQDLQEQKRAYMREYARKRRASDPAFLERCRKLGRQSRARRVEVARQEALEWKQSNKNKVAEYNKNYVAANKETIAQQRSKRAKLRRQKDPVYLLICRERLRVWEALKGKRKSARTETLLGCSYEFFKNYIESKFVDGMTWENSAKWHIDHIKPLASFDLSCPKQQKLAFHYTNQRPLWAIENLKKGAKIA